MIRGIRSFESDSGEAATITFYSPLTLITGHNGSGKTTIIECLKYATTGDTPPGSKGGAFVNDPKMSDSPSIKAQVRLRFKNVNHQTMSIVRSLSVTVNKKAYTQKTLENVLAVVDPQTGELATISAKCAELDADVPNHLGVSRAILDNVIFCHQEESNWPLSEPSILKKKFDDIFASTKYTNVLDSIKNIRKDKSQDLKVMQTSLEFIRRNKEKAEKAGGNTGLMTLSCIHGELIRETLAKTIENTEHGRHKIDQLELDIDKCADEASTLMEKTKELQAIETSRSALSHEHRATLANIQELEGTFALYTESDSELQEMLYRHDLSLKTADQEKSKHERLKQQAASSISNLQMSVNSNQQSIGQLKAQLESSDKKQADRDHLISELARLYAFDGFDSLPLSNVNVSRFSNKLEIHVQQKMADVDRIKGENRNKEQGVRSQIAEKKARTDMLSSFKSKSQAAISSAKAKLQQQTLELSKYQSAAADIESMEKLLEQQEAAMAALKSREPSLESLELKRRSRTADIEAYEDELSRLSDQRAAQIENAGSQARLALLKDKSSQRAGEIKRIMVEHHDAFLKALGFSPEPDAVEHHLEPIIMKAEETVNSSRNELEQRKRDSSAYDRKIAAECGTEEFPELLASKEEATAELREQVQDMKTMSTMYGRFVVMAEKKHACPLCSRGFDAPLEAQFTAKLRRLMEKAENDDERELAASEASLASLRSLKSIWDTVEQLKTTEIPALEGLLGELEEKKLAASDLLESANVKAAALAAELEDLRRLSIASRKAAELSKENNEDNSLIRELESALMVAGSTQSAEELQTEYNDVKFKIQVARQELIQLQQEITTTTTEIQRKEQGIRSLKEKHSQAMNQLHRLDQVKEQVAESENIIQGLTQEIEQHERESQDVMPELNSLDEQLKQVTVDGQAKEMGVQQIVSELQKNMGRLQMYNKDIERVDVKATTIQLSNLEAVTDTYIEEIHRHTDEVHAAEKQMQALQEQLSEFKSMQRNIDDNLRYRRYKVKAAELEAKIKELNDKMDGGAQGTYLKQLNRLRQRQSDLAAERAGLQGELRQLQDQRRGYEFELSGEYKDVVQKYHDSLIGYKTTELALQDLEKYTKALQSAIVEYHSMKMEEINKTIKELWTNTYRGTDIDTIEIRSDQEGMRANQTYNYRVVMIQRARALDMRGRCSAGQKVLASIIIRLALAESFSLNCGILALDEPTTNLDEANVAQLAQSLRMIIDKHRQQSNFQLIVITHDEDFLKMLNLTDYVDYYYRVQKNAE
ncbi:DNA repair protein rad50 [Mortierella claussenii]|nr:DNA repair protein rad50 [Mortierella claussenii]